MKASKVGGDLNELEGQPEDSRFVIWSTSETIKNEIPSVTGIAETIIAVSAYWWVAIHFETYLPFIVSVGTAAAKGAGVGFLLAAIWIGVAVAVGLALAGSGWESFFGLALGASIAMGVLSARRAQRRARESANAEPRAGAIPDILV